MLAGTKQLATFSDAIRLDGSIAEEIIPEEKFRSYVAAGIIKRFAHELQSPFRTDHPDFPEYPTIRRVYFTLPGEEWRAEFMLWHHTRIHANTHRTTCTVDSIIEGRLLGYTEQDIATCISLNSSNACLYVLGLPQPHDQ